MAKTWYTAARALAVIVILGLVVACAPAASPGETTGYTDISVEQLAAMMADKDFVLVNTHVPYEGELPQTDLFIPFDEIADHLDELPGQGEKIVLYCRSGSMSTTAAGVLVSLGYTNVFELDGGMNSWQAAGYEFIE